VYTLLIILFIVVCFFLILVVLLQQGKGADVAAAFGGSSSQASFGPRGTATLMHKLTTGSFVLFVVLCLGLSVLTARRGRSVTAGVKGKAPASAPAPVKPAVPAPTTSQPAAPAQAPATTSQPAAPTPAKK
jgi:preprotein translocase subunit SecG